MTLSLLYCRCNQMSCSLQEGEPFDQRRTFWKATKQAYILVMTKEASHQSHYPYRKHAYCLHSTILAQLCSSAGLCSRFRRCLLFDISPSTERFHPACIGGPLVQHVVKRRKTEIRTSWQFLQQVIGVPHIANYLSRSLPLTSLSIWTFYDHDRCTTHPMLVTPAVLAIPYKTTTFCHKRWAYS